MLNIVLVLLGKVFGFISSSFNLGHGSTWPGHIALIVNKDFIKEIIKLNPQLKIVLIAGTNGKTTTGKLIQSILEKAKYRVFQNESGANLLNGIASSILLHSSILSTIDYDYAIFEVDENTLPLALKEITPNYLILLNLFRDQLDRYGEVNTIAKKWGDAVQHLLPKTGLILNADDPQIAHLGSRVRSKKSYFGIKDKTLTSHTHQHAVDSTYCPNCRSKLTYSAIYYSHLGDWKCKNCGYKRPINFFSTPPPGKLVGTYNLYNILAASLAARKIRVSDDIINKSVKTFIPAFGRQEILYAGDKKIQIFLSKNPISFNESLRTVTNLEAKHILFVLNDRIPDGRDVSWIWDVDFEIYVDSFENIMVSGERCYDMGLRIKYSSKFSIFNFQFSMKNSNFKFQIEENLRNAITLSLKILPKTETLYVLPTYSAMLEVRKILTGKKIL